MDCQRVRSRDGIKDLGFVSGGPYKKCYPMLGVSGPQFMEAFFVV